MIAGPLAGLNKLMNRKTFRAELEREQVVIGQYMHAEDKTKAHTDVNTDQMNLAGHVVFLGFNEIGEELAEFFRLEQEGQNVNTTSNLLH